MNADPDVTPDTRESRFRDPMRWLQRRREYVYQLIGAEISATSRYYDSVIQVMPLRTDDGYLMDRIECVNKARLQHTEDLPDATNHPDERVLVILNGNFNHEPDLQQLLADLKRKLARTSRLAVVIYNPYLSWLYKLANLLGLRKGELPRIFLTTNDLGNICRLAGFEIVRFRLAGYFPFHCFGLGAAINRLLPAIPLVRWLGFACIVVLRPVIPEADKPSLSIVIPARNERGNIENALRRIPDLDGTEIEVIFVEGHSTDGTWEEIQRVLPLYSDRFRLQAHQQPGAGKQDALRVGFEAANCEVLTVLDADLTMPPESLGWFYDAYCRALGDFVNGNRLLYPMEGKAMRALNSLGNVFFAKALSNVLGVRIGDALCGTKLFARHDYNRMAVWREDFGKFDPFGDFEMLFFAAELALGVVDIPISYAARTYGETNINRFRDGWTLLNMTLIGLLRIRLGKAPVLRKTHR